MAGYVWNGTAWRQLNEGYTWNGSAWKKITSGYTWNGSLWKLMFSSGTFFPLIQNSNGDTFANRGVGISMYGYRGSTDAGTYTYTWQQAYGSNYTNGTWSTGNGTGSSGSLSGVTLTTPVYRNTAADLLVLTNKIYGYKFYMRFRVIKSAETQYSPEVRIVKRTPSIGIQSISATRYYYPYASYQPNLKNPYVGDTLVFWTSNDWNKTSTDGTLTNDIVPDYYIFEYTTGNGYTTKDSRITDVSDPAIPTNASKYIPVTADLLYPVSVLITAYCSDVNTGTSTVSTKNVDDGILKPPANLTLTFIGNVLHGQWNDSDGGNANSITYRYELYIGSTLVTTSTAGGLPVFGFNYTPSLAGLYYFRVRAEQTGSTTTAWAVSDTLDVQPPSNFTYTLTNVTATELTPTNLSINAFVSSTTTLNKWDVSWTVPTTAVSGDSISGAVFSYSDTWTYPVNYSPGTVTGSATTDFWYVFDTGNHKLSVTATQKTYQKVRFSWTKPTGTSAVSYKITYLITAGGTPYTATQNVEDVTNYDLLIDTRFVTRVSILSITAYSGATQTALTKSGTGVTGQTALLQSQLEVTSSQTVERTQYLTLIVVQVGTMTVYGDFESNGTLFYSYNNDWTPVATDSRWSFTHTWGRTNYKNGLADTYLGGNTVSFVISTSSTYVGEYFKLRTVSNFINSSVFTNTSYTPNGLVTTPAPPAALIVNNYNNTFTISSVTAWGANYYWGDYTGGGINDTIVTSSYTSPVLSSGSKTINLYSAIDVYYNVPYSTRINSRRKISTTLDVTAIADFTYSISDVTGTPTTTGTPTYRWNNYVVSDPNYGTRVDIDWSDASGYSTYYSYIVNGGTVRGNYRSSNSDFWSTVSGTTYNASVYAVNASGVARVYWSAVAGANSYKVNYTIGASTYTTAATTNTFYEFPVTISPGTGGTIGNAISPTVNNVTAFPTYDGTGQGKNGTVSGSRSVTVYQKNSAARSTGNFTAPTYVPAVSTPTAINAYVQSASIFVSFSGGSGDFYDVYYANSNSAPTNGQAFSDFPGVTSPYNTNLTTTGIQRWFWVRKRTGTTYSNWLGPATATIPAPSPATAPGTPGTVSNGYTGGTNYPFSWGAGTTGTVSGGGAATITAYTMKVYEATSSGGAGATLRATLSLGSSTSYTYTSPNAARYYAAQVSATNSAGLSSGYGGLSSYR